jgi:hypothetical protein
MAWSLAGVPTACYFLAKKACERRFPHCNRFLSVTQIHFAMRARSADYCHRIPAGVGEDGMPFAVPGIGFND